MGAWARKLPFAVVTAVICVAFAVPAVPAFAQYAPAPPPAPGVGAGFTTVVAVCTVAASGGTCTADVNGAAITVTLPSGDITQPDQIEFLAGSSDTICGGAGELAFGVQLSQDGVKLPGPFPNPIGVTASDPTITAGSTVFVVSGTGCAADSSFTTTAGSATGSFTSDIDFVIAAVPTAAPTASTVPSATIPLTGEPFVGEGLIAIGLVAVGGLGLWRWRRATRPSI